MAEIIVLEAQNSDSEAIFELLNNVCEESEFVTRDTASSQMSLEELCRYIDNQSDSSNEICLVAKLENKVIGILNISSVGNVGDVFLAVLEKYRGYGIGQLLMDALIDWVEHTPVIKCLELTVQVKNEIAIYIYKKYGFVIEGIQKRAVKTRDGEFRDVYAMARLMN